MTLKVVDFPESKAVMDKEVAEKLVKQLDELKESIQKGELVQIVLQYDTVRENPDKNGEPVTATDLIFWNEDGDIDQTIGFAERLKIRIIAITEAVG